MTIERRKSPRTQPEKLTYIHLQSDNGAIILNFSENGLCFRSAEPILETGPIRFTFSLQSGEQPQAIGELVWTDKARKKGGLRLTELPAGARNPLNVGLRRLPSESIEKIRVDSVSLAKQPKAEVPARKNSSALNKTAPSSAPAVSHATVRAAAVTPTAPSRAIVRIADKLKAAQGRYIPGDTWRDLPAVDWGVIGGFALFVIFAVVLVHAYAGRLGQSLTQVQASARSVPAADSHSAIPASETSQASPILQELRAQIAALESEPENGRGGESAGTGARNRKSDLSEQGDSVRQSDPAISAAAETETDILPQPVRSDGDAGASLDAGVAPNSGAAAAGNPGAADVDVNPALATYYDVGNFKDLARADRTTNDLGKLGFRAIVVHKTLLWMGSFHVVVGPFGSDEDSEAARSRLETFGFSPRVTKTH